MAYLFSPLDDIRSFFLRFGAVTVDWPHKSHSKGCIPPKGTLLLALHMPIKRAYRTLITRNVDSLSYHFLNYYVLYR